MLLATCPPSAGPLSPAPRARGCDVATLPAPLAGAPRASPSPRCEPAPHASPAAPLHRPKPQREVPADGYRAQYGERRPPPLLPSRRLTHCGNPLRAASHSKPNGRYSPGVTTHTPPPPRPPGYVLCRADAVVHPTSTAETSDAIKTYAALAAKQGKALKIRMSRK